MDVTDLLLAPVRVPLRVARALDDLSALADRARREPDPVEEVRDRLDRALAELERVGSLAQTLNQTLLVALQAIEALRRVGENVDVTGQQIVLGGQDLTTVARQLEGDSRELIDGGEDLTAVSKRIERDLQVFRALVPRLVGALDTMERLEGEVETVAETMEPLQDAAERVGRVTKRLSRRS